MRSEIRTEWRVVETSNVDYNISTARHDQENGSFKNITSMAGVFMEQKSSMRKYKVRSIWRQFLQISNISSPMHWYFINLPSFQFFFMTELHIFTLSYLITMLFSYPSQPKYRVHSFVFFFWKNQRMTFRSFWKPISSFKRINDFSMNLFLNLLLHDINCKDWDWQDYLSYAAFLVEMIYPFLLASRGWLIFIEKFW